MRSAVTDAHSETGERVHRIDAAETLNEIAVTAYRSVSGASPTAIDQKARVAALEALTARHQEDAERQEGRIASVEGRLAGMATVAATLAVVILANVDKFDAAASFIQWGLIVLMLTLGIAALGRVIPRFRVRTLLSTGKKTPTRSQQAAETAADLAFRVEQLLSSELMQPTNAPASGLGHRAPAPAQRPPTPSVEVAAQVALLAYWRARACSDHHAYNARARWAAASAVALAVA